MKLYPLSRIPRPIFVAARLFLTPLGDTVPVALNTSSAIQDQSDLPIGGAPALTEETGGSPTTRLRQGFGRVRRSWGN